MRSTKLPSSIERLLGLGPQSAPPHVFAVDASGLTYAQFGRGDRSELEHYVHWELEPESFLDGPLGGPVRDLERFSQGIVASVGELDPKPQRASLVLPDQWLRLVFAEADELPSRPQVREEALRWTLKRLVPFRVEDLRIRGMNVPRLADQEQPNRLLLGFGMELLLSQLESAFQAAGVRIGIISNASMSLLNALATAHDDGLWLLVRCGDSDWNVMVAQGSTPVLYRYKSRPVSSEDEAGLVRELRLTRGFLDQKFSGGPLGRAVVAAPDELQSSWSRWIESGLDLSAEILGDAHLAVEGNGRGDWAAIAPLLGMARQEVW